MKVAVIFNPDEYNLGGPLTNIEFLKSCDFFEILPIKHYKNFFLRNLRHFILILKNLKKYNFFLVQGIHIPSLFFANIFKKKFYLKVTGDLAFERYKGKLVSIEEFQRISDKKIWLLRKFWKFYINSFNKIWVPCEFLKRLLEGWGIRKEIKVIPNYVDWDCQVDESLAERFKDIKGFKIFTLGRLIWQKGILELVDVVKEIEGVVLFIAGDGPLRERLEEKIRNNSKFIYLGKINRRQVLGMMRFCDILVLNSYYEGLSHVLLEAMSSGICILTTKTSGNLEIIEDKKNGILVECGNKKQLKENIELLKGDKSLRQRLGEEGKKYFYKKFKKEKIIEELRNFFLN